MTQSRPGLCDYGLLLLLAVIWGSGNSNIACGRKDGWSVFTEMGDHMDLDRIGGLFR
jgi:hypothetical protein